jgi:hypothetical protein
MRGAPCHDRNGHFWRPATWHFVWPGQGNWRCKRACALHDCSPRPNTFIIKDKAPEAFLRPNIASDRPKCAQPTPAPGAPQWLADAQKAS